MATGDDNTLSASMNKFTASLFEVVLKKAGKKENVFISPFSVYITLGMTHVGARGTTAQQLKDALHFAQDETPNEMFSHLLENVKGTESITLDVANKAYVTERYQILEEFQNTLSTFFKSSSESIDFASSNAHKIINAWVEEQTRNKIKDLIPEGVLDSLTVLVLVNAVYFKGSWLRKFDEKMTRKVPFFYGTDNESIEVPMMHINGDFRVGELPELHARILELPYERKTLSMFIVLPNEKDGLSSLESKIVCSNLLEEGTKSMGSVKLQVAIPKFKVEAAVKMNEPLTELGISDLFGKKADLSAISDVKDLYVSDMFHKAFVEVNEEGTEAAAATAGIMMTRMMMIPPPPFIADHPFLFFIRNNALKTILFIGRCANPPV